MTDSESVSSDEPQQDIGGKPVTAKDLEVF